VLEEPERLAATVSKYLPVVTKVQFYRLQRTFMRIENRWERAAATYVLDRTSFSGAIASGGFSSLEKNGRNGRFHEGNVEFLKDFRVPAGKLSVEFVSFEESILRHPDAFLFLDPPYIVESKLYGRRGNLQAIDHVLLAGILRSRDNWMLCYNDCPEVRRLYRGLPFVDKDGGLFWNYGMNVSKESNEILILSTDVAEQVGVRDTKRVRSTGRRAVQEGVPRIG
jgi:DNA adenine methylase